MSFQNTLFLAAAFSLAVFAEGATANDEKLDKALSCANPADSVRLEFSKPAAGQPVGVRELVSETVVLPLNKQAGFEDKQRHIEYGVNVTCKLDMSKIGAIKDFKVQYTPDPNKGWTDLPEDQNSVDGGVPLIITYTHDQPLEKWVEWTIQEKAFAIASKTHDVWNIRFVAHY